MAVFAIVLDKPNDDVWKKVTEGWLGAHIIHDERVAFVRDSVKKLTSQICEEVGVSRDVPGFVVRADYFGGYGKPTLAEWMEKSA